jgi:hypothetical protein
MIMINRIKYYFTFRKVRKRFILLGQMIDAIDKGFNKHNISRQKRRQFWEDFIKNPESRKKFIQEMRQNIGR